MATQVLEQLVVGAPKLSKESLYGTIDLYTAETVALFTPPVGPAYGLLNKQPFQMGYDMPSMGAQLHLHGPNLNTITSGTIYDYNRNPLRTLNGYEASIASLNADRLGLPRFP